MLENQWTGRECDQWRMLLSGLKTLLVVLGLQRNGQDRDSEDTSSLVTSPQPPEAPALPASPGHQGRAQTLGLKYEDLVPAPRDLFECSKKYIRWETGIDAITHCFRSWQTDKVQNSVETWTEDRAEIYLSCWRHNLIMQVLTWSRD